MRLPCVKAPYRLLPHLLFLLPLLLGTASLTPIPVAPQDVDPEFIVPNIDLSSMRYGIRSSLSLENPRLSHHRIGIATNRPARRKSSTRRTNPPGTLLIHTSFHSLFLSNSVTFIRG